MRNKIRFIGLVFILISLISISLTLIIKQRNTYDAVAFSGIVQAGGYNETSYHTMIFAKSRLNARAARQEIPLEHQLLAFVMLLAGLVGLAVSIARARQMK